MNLVKTSKYLMGFGDSITMHEHVADNSVHAVITDPPYGMELMNLDWDKVLPPKEIWRRCFNALRPGGFCLAFGYPRLYHRLGVDLEDAGFQIKDCLGWLYASGYPHSYDISKAFDKEAGVEREIVARRVHPTLKNKPKVKSNAYHVDSLTSDQEMESWDITAPASENAKIWNGWGTKLKPSWEPIILAQKPMEGRYIDNILKYKVGALNIDACRIPFVSEEDKKSLESFLHFEGKDIGDSRFFSANSGGKKQVNVHPLGRWPANIMWLDPLYADYDRFFMVPKPSTSEKGEYNEHDTVKPIRLMERLISLVTPKPSDVKEDVIVLDPYMGSGTTGIACKNLGRYFIGFEKHEPAFTTASRRLSERKSGYYDIFER